MTSKEKQYILSLSKDKLYKIREEGTVLLITSTQAKAIRRKQADKNLTAKKASEEIGVNPITYRKIRDGGEVKPSIYQKAMEWLAEDY